MLNIFNLLSIFSFTYIGTQTFYVAVYAFQNYTDGDLMIEGSNLAGVVKVDQI